MASRTPRNEEKPGPEGSETPPDRPLLDLSDVAVRALIRTAKRRGYVSHDQINGLLSSEEVNSEQIENILAMFSEIGINMVEAQLEDEVTPREQPEGQETEGESSELIEIKRQTVPDKSDAKELQERTDHPVRMHLREMASVELLSRDGEIAIAKRIEASREAMIAGLCESPLTFQAIIIWRDELNDATALLRDIIDLNPTEAGPDPKAPPPPEIGPDGQMITSLAVPGQPRQMPAPGTTPVAIIQLGPGAKSTDGDATAIHGMISESNLEDDDDDKESWFSTAPAEAELKPQIGRAHG